MTAYTVGESGVGWDKILLGQCPPVLNESPDCDTNDVFEEHVTTVVTGATRIIDASFASVNIAKKKITTKVDSCLRVSNWAGKLVTRRITVRASTRMMYYVRRNLPNLLPIFCQVGT